MELPIYNINGQTTGQKATLDDTVFNVEPNDHAIYLDVKLLDANQRQGTAKTKERGEVSGTTKKPFRQKGTGGARQGHMRSPHMRHGGTVFGPRPRDYSFKLNKKLRRLARRSAISYKVRENKITIVDNFTFTEAKTKAFNNLLKALQLTDVKTLWVTSQYDSNLYLASRNVDKNFVVHAAQINTKQILNADRVVIVKDAISILQTNLEAR